MIKRRSFLALIGAAPLAAKATVDTKIAEQVGIRYSGLGDSTSHLASGECIPGSVNEGPFIPYGKRLVGVADYIKVFGIPEVVDVELRDRSKYVMGLDPDIACKQSWSMSVKIMTQRQRNYDREIQRLKVNGWVATKKSALKSLIGFEWPY